MILIIIGTILPVFGVIAWLIFSSEVYEDKKDPSLAVYSQALNAEKKGDYKRAEQLFVESLKLNPSHSKSYLQLLYLYKKNKKKEKLFELYKTLLELGTENLKDIDFLKLRQEFCALCWEEKAYSDCFRHSHLLLKEMKDPSVQRKVAWIYASQGKYLSALKIYESLYEPMNPSADIVREMALCLIGIKEEQKALQMLDQLLTLPDMTPKDFYLKAKYLHSLGRYPEAEQGMILFLGKASWKDGYSTQEALSYCLKDYFSGPKELNQEMVLKWIQIFDCAIRLVEHDKNKRMECLWHQAFLYFFRDYKSGYLKFCLETLQKIIAIDSNYKESGLILEKVKTGGSGLFEDMTRLYIKNFANSLNQSSEFREFSIQDFYGAKAFDIDSIENELNSGFFSKKSSLRDTTNLFSMDVTQFELKMTQVLRSLGYTIMESFAKEAGKNRLQYLITKENQAPLYCCLYRDTREVGEVEIKEIRAEMQKRKTNHCLVITLGKFTASALQSSRNGHFTLIDGEDLKDRGYQL